jgi:hypothetical protein
MLKVLYIGFKTQDILYNLLSTNNINIDSVDDITNENLYDYNIIISNNIKIDDEHKHKVISYVSKTSKICHHNVLLYGNVINSNNSIKLPNYDINNNVNKISFDDFINKRYASLISNHDDGNTKTLLYNKLSLLGKIVCPLKLFNNFPEEEYKNSDFLKEFIFNICVESHSNDCVSNKLSDAVLSGCIPIYYGKMDELDKLIFNMDRIIFCDVNNPESIDNTFNFVKSLFSNPQKLYNYYLQPIFNENALDIINEIKVNCFNRINSFINNNLIFGNLYKDTNNDLVINFDSDIIISLSTSLSNLQSDIFQDNILKLLNMKLKPKYVIVKVDIEGESYLIQNKTYPTLIIHCYNSMYKNYNIDNLLLLSTQLNILDNDKIIFINDNFVADNNLTVMYELCYQLYNCSGVVVNNDDSNCMFSDLNYNINEDLSYSLKFKYIKNLKFDNNQLLECCDISNNLYMGNIHTLLCSNDVSSFAKLKPNYSLYFKIDNDILPRTLLYNVSDIKQTYNNNKHIDIKYFNSNSVLLTITYFDFVPISDEITLRIFNYDYKVNISNNKSHKQTYLLSLNKNISYILHKNYNTNIIQCYKDNNMDINKYYSISTILNYIPDMTYKFFNNNDIYIFMTQDSNILKLYENNNSVRLKNNLFKLFYLYNLGGLYINCKSILYHPLNLDNNIFVKDIHDNKLSTSFYYVNDKHDDIIGQELINKSKDIYNMSYNESLSIYNLELLYKKECHHHWRDCVIKYKDNIIIKSSHYNYKDYINEDYLWRYKKLYNKIL